MATWAILLAFAAAVVVVPVDASVRGAAATTTTSSSSSSSWGALTESLKAAAAGISFGGHVKMETQLTIPDELATWKRTGEALDHEWHEMTFAVKQNNIEHLKRRIEQTSDLDSPMYGQHLSHEGVGNLVRNDEGTSAVTEWLESNGVVASATMFGEYIRAGSTVGVWQELLAAKFHRYEPTDPGGKKRGFVLRAREYSLPARIAKHVDCVLKVTHLPSGMTKIRGHGSLVPLGHKEEEENNARRVENEERLRRRLLAGAPTPVPSRPPTLEPTASPSVSNAPTMAPTDEYTGSVTPKLLNSLYNITDNSAPYGSFGVFEALGLYGSSTDLALYLEHFNLANTTIGNVVGGHYAANIGLNKISSGEANADVQYLLAVASGRSKKLWYWYTDESYGDWLASVADSSSYPLIFSISYLGYEGTHSHSDMAQFEKEAIKLAAKGVTLVNSAGDDGTVGYNGREYAEKSEAKQTAFCKQYGYSPQFPSSSPYVVSVGGTNGPQNGKEEVVSSTQTGAVITSGGGFSEYFSVPDYQADYTKAYFDTPSGMAAKPGYKTRGRGYPDVAALASNYEIAINGSLSSQDGYLYLL